MSESGNLSTEKKDPLRVCELLLMLDDNRLSGEGRASILNLAREIAREIINGVKK